MNSIDGVYEYNERLETYYSSNVLVHKDIDKWQLDNEGCWRDENGFYVCASNDYPKGTIIDMSKGKGIILDCGCDSGKLDVYVNW